MAYYLRMERAMTLPPSNVTVSPSSRSFRTAQISGSSFLLALAAFLMLTFSAVAQVSSGILVGTVLDATGAIVPNVKIEAKNSATGVVSATTATQSGEYRVGGLLPGNYSLTASATGFSSVNLENVTVEAN